MTKQEQLELARRALAGDGEAAATLNQEIFSQLQAILMGACDDDRSKEKAREIAADLRGEAFRCPPSRPEKMPLLARYRGKGGLLGFFVRIGMNRLKDWWRSPDYRAYTSLESGLEPTVESERRSDEVAKLVEVGLRTAFAELDASHSVFLQLVFLHGVQQRQVAQMLGHDAATTSRWLRRSLARIRGVAYRTVLTLDPNLDLHRGDFIQFCRDYPGKVTSLLVRGQSHNHGARESS